MIRDASLHCRGHSQTGMNSAKMIVSEMQSNGGFQVEELFAESVRQPSEPPAHHPNRQILAFEVRRAHELRITIPGQTNSTLPVFPSSTTHMVTSRSCGNARRG